MAVRYDVTDDDRIAAGIAPLGSASNGFHVDLGPDTDTDMYVEGSDYNPDPKFYINAEGAAGDSGDEGVESTPPPRNNIPNPADPFTSPLLDKANEWDRDAARNWRAGMPDDATNTAFGWGGNKIPDFRNQRFFDAGGMRAALPDVKDWHPKNENKVKLGQGQAPFQPNLALRRAMRRGRMLRKGGFPDAANVLVGQAAQNFIGGPALRNNAMRAIQDDINNQAARLQAANRAARNAILKNPMDAAKKGLRNLFDNIFGK